jgi:Putative prokaryotic signal transducing protein
MITLRTYSNPTEAGLAQAHLEAAGIPVELADVYANSNTIAQFAIPVRLLVPEERRREALEILDSETTTETDK